jgi:hypothetical protein
MLLAFGYISRVRQEVHYCREHVTVKAALKG